jgi:hypothetical protein
MDAVKEVYMRSSSWLGMLSLLVVGCSLDVESTGTASESIIGGSTEVRPGSEAVVFLGECSGVLVNANTVLSAEHCLPLGRPEDGPPPVARLSLRRGAHGEVCLTPSADGECAEWDLTIARQPASDLIALRSKRPFAGVDAGDLPVLRTSFAPAVGQAHGFGLSEGEVVGLRVSAPIRIAQYGDDYVYGRTAPDVRVCGGDSGGPLFGEPGLGRPVVLLGVLSATQYDPADPACTAAGGLNRFARVDPAFLRAVAGPCAESAGNLDCRSGGSAAIDLAALAPPRAPSGMELMRQAGVELVDPAGVSAERVKREGLVGVAIEEGTFYGRLPAGARTTDVSSVRPGGGNEGEMVPLSPRAISLSGNGDQRSRLFVVQAGGIALTSTTATPICTGTLIGSRIVRTAKHCIENTTRPWFTARYDGGPTTWTFNGGATFVTFNPRQADGHFFGGNYFNFGCQNGSSSGTCIAEDWALLIMPQNVWQPVHVVPAFMGFAFPGTGAVTHSGYARCSDISSPSAPNCVTGFMYGMDCSVVVNNGNHYFTNCDTSPGHSGAGTFFTSGGTRFLIGNHKGGPSNAGCSNGTCTSYDCGTNGFLFDFQLQQRNNFSAVTL